MKENYGKHENFVSLKILGQIERTDSISNAKVQVGVGGLDGGGGPGSQVSHQIF